MTERDVLVTFVTLLGAMMVIGAVLPVLAPWLIRLVDRNVLKTGDEETEQH